MAPAAALGSHAHPEACAFCAGGRAADRRPAGHLPPPVDLGPDLADVDGELALTPEAPVSADTSLPLRLAATAARLDRPIAKGSLYRLADRMPEPGDPWTTETRQALVDLLALGPPAVDKIESLDQHGLFVRLLPEWAAVRNKPQRNAYHRFTVDRHLLETAALGRGSDRAGRTARPPARRRAAARHRQGIPGRPHRRSASRWSDASTARMGFSPVDVDVLVDLVRHHLLLPDTATRRDLDDPTTIANVARAAGNRLTLHLLAALTEADSRATGPSAWGPWKAGLVADLVERTDKLLQGHDSVPAARHPPGRAPASSIDEVRQTALPSVLLQPPQVIVAAPDRRGLLSSVAGALALHGMDVRAANVAGEDGVAVEVFTVEVARGTWPDTAKFREDLTAVLSDQRRPRRAPRRARAALRPTPALRRPPSRQRRRRGQRRLRHRHRARIAGSRRNWASCTGSPGPSSRPNLDVVSARVSTLGEMVVDAFYVREPNGAKVTDPERLAAVTVALRSELGL